jgi:pyruvate ferredoxin oxidoreductase beta subunit
MGRIKGGLKMTDIRIKGNRTCGGCGGSLAEKLIFEVTGKNVIIHGSGVCAGFSTTMLPIPKLTLHFSGGGGAGGAGIAAALKATGRDDIPVLAFGGDGAVSDISFAQVSACAQRNDNMIFFCMDNEAYMNTGNQKSTLTPYGAASTTSPSGHVEWKKDLPLIMAMHRPPYVATVSPAYPQDLKNKVKKALGIKGYRYIHVLAPCPTGWGHDPAKTVRLARDAVRSGLFPLYEVENGNVTITFNPKERVPIKEYTSQQRRFQYLEEKEIDYLQTQIEERWNNLIKLSELHN